MFWADGWCCFWWCHRMIQPWTQPFRAMPGSATPELSLYTLRSSPSSGIEKLIDYLYFIFHSFFDTLWIWLNFSESYASMGVLYVHNSIFSQATRHVIINLIAIKMCSFLCDNHFSAIIQLNLFTEFICKCNYGDGILTIWCWEIIWFSDPASTEPTQNSPGNQSIIRFSTHSAPSTFSTPKIVSLINSNSSIRIIRNHYCGFLLSVYFSWCDDGLRVMISSIRFDLKTTLCIRTLHVFLSVSALRTSRSHEMPTGRGPTFPGVHAGITAGDVMHHGHERNADKLKSKITDRLFYLHPFS